MAQSDNSSNIVQTVGWQSDPNNGRGTFSLVSSCLLTLVICVYSAMHLNVPPPRESRLQYWVRTIRWGFWGVFGPELVLFVAWKQYLSAKAVVQRTTRPRSAERGSEQRVVKEKQESMVTAFPILVNEDCILNWHRKAQRCHPLSQAIPPHLRR